MRIGYLPLDERPVHLRYPQMLGEIADVDVIIPPTDILSHLREPGDVDALASWLRETATTVDALIVSVDMLAYGGSIASRISHDASEAVLERLDVLRGIRLRSPEMPIYGFSVITRVAHHHSAVEEPDYWVEFGGRLATLSRAISRRKNNAIGSDSWRRSFEGIPTEVTEDFFKRRARNHQVNRAALTLTADGTFNLLVLSAGDTDRYSLTSDEKGLLRDHVEELHLSEKVLFATSADELPLVLIARLLNEKAGHAPVFQPVYLLPEARHTTPMFDNQPASGVVSAQIEAAGATRDRKEGDVLLLVNPPMNPPQEWVRDFLHEDEPEDARLAAYDGAANAIRAALRQGHQVALADIAYTNGASHDLLISLDAAGVLSDLTAFAAWNTAANTVGTAVAMACASMHGTNPKAADRFLAHRLIEDWGYQTITRTLARKMVESETGASEPSAERIESLREWVAQGLERFAETHKLGWKPVNVRFPWGRTFEIDFELEEG